MLTLKLCKLRDGASEPLSIGHLCSTSHRCQVNTLTSFSRHSWAIFAVWQGALSAAKGHCHYGVLLPWRGVLSPQNVYVGCICLSNIHINSRTESFQAEHCPEHRTALANLASSLSLSSAVFLSGKCCTQPSMWCSIKCDSSDQGTLFIVSYFSSDAHKPTVGDFGGVRTSAWAFWLFCGYAVL